MILVVNRFEMQLIWSSNDLDVNWFEIQAVVS